MKNTTTNSVHIKKSKRFTTFTNKIGVIFHNGDIVLYKGKLCTIDFLYNNITTKYAHITENVLPNIRHTTEYVNINDLMKV